MKKMALTRKTLKAMGLTEEQVDSIVEAHGETVDGLKSKLKDAEERAGKADDLQKIIDDLKAKSEDGYREKYEAEHRAFEDYKADIAGKEIKRAKENAVRAYFESKNITGGNLDIAMRGCKDEVEAVELDGDNIKDTAALDQLVSGTYAGLVVTTSTTGVTTPTPPQSTGDTKPTKADLYKKDDHGRYIMSASERQAALVENHTKKGEI